MAQKIHLRATSTKSVCSSAPADAGRVRSNARSTYGNIPASLLASPDDFRAAADADRCAHCAGMFTEVMNRRRALSGKPAYANAMTKELA